METAIYNARKKINEFANSLDERTRYEYNNVIDRMVLNIVNGESALEKARAEAREKGIDADMINEAYELFAKAMKKKTKFDFPHELRDKLEFLCKKYPDVDVETCKRCTVRYAALGFGGQQWALGTEMMAHIAHLGIDMEAFASPFNNYFPKYCSVFEADAPFGSQGDFFHATLPDALYVNPPFVPALLARVPERIKNIKRCVVITPTWRDAPWYIELSKHFTANTKTNETYRALGREFTPRFTTTLWTRGLSAKEIKSLL